MSVFFLFKQKTAYEMRISDWSSDVCSSDLAPYLFEVEGALFLSNKGDLLGRLEGYYDQRITQRLVLQPRVELNLSAQDVPENRLGSGLTNAELGFRLRYEITRQFAPYIGVSYDAKTGRSADFARTDGEEPTTTSFVAGVRHWFCAPQRTRSEEHPSELQSLQANSQ